MYTLESNGLNKVKEIKNVEELVPFVIPFSKTVHSASKIVKKHFKVLQQ